MLNCKFNCVWSGIANAAQQGFFHSFINQKVLFDLLFLDANCLAQHVLQYLVIHLKLSDFQVSFRFLEVAELPTQFRQNVDSYFLCPFSSNRYIACNSIFQVKKICRKGFFINYNFVKALII